MTPTQCRAARAWLDWTQRKLASKSGVSEASIRNFEGSRRPGFHTETVTKLRAALEIGGIEFVDDGQRLGVMRKERPS